VISHPTLPIISQVTRIEIILTKGFTIGFRFVPCISGTERMSSFSFRGISSGFGKLCSSRYTGRSRISLASRLSERCSAARTPIQRRLRADRTPTGSISIFLTAQTLAAVTLAKTRAESITLRLGRGSSKVGVNRREQIADGSVILGENPDGPIDREAILVALDGSGETPIAEVCSFATHGTVMGGDNYQLSGDWCGIAASELEQKTQAFIYMNGECADVNPRGRTQPSTFSVAEALAEEFVGDIESTRGNTNALDGDDLLTGAFTLIELPHKQGEIEAGKGRTARIRIHGIRFGPVRIVGFPGEVFGETAMAVKQAYASDVVAVNSYTTGGSAGYVPVREAYDTGGYEMRVSPYSKDAEDVLRQAFIDLVKELG